MTHGVRQLSCARDRHGGLNLLLALYRMEC